MNKLRLGPPARFAALGAALLLMARAPAFAADYGLILVQSAQVAEEGVEFSADSIEYTLQGAPWLSMELGDAVALYFSAGVRVDREQGAWTFAPELYRFQAAFQVLSRLRIELGRFHYQDSLDGLVAAGLFDGLSFSLSLPGSRLFLGGQYAGFQYKKTARIAMNTADEALYLGEPDYSGIETFFDSYFASRRALAFLGWELDLLGGLFSLEALAQLDLNGRDVPLHTGYLMGRYTRPIGNLVQIDLGGAASLIQDGDEPLGLGFAGSAALGWLLPTRIPDELRFSFRGSSGESEGMVAAFCPVSTTTVGQVLRAPLPGLLSVDAAYALRVLRSLSLGIQGACLLRSDLSTYQDPALALGNNAVSYLVGEEAYAQLVWTPLSDLSFNLGGGVFFPNLRGTYVGGTPLRWRLNVGSTISF
jgi:hypothetical protein